MRERDLALSTRESSVWFRVTCLEHQELLCYLASLLGRSKGVVQYNPVAHEGYVLHFDHGLISLTISYLGPQFYWFMRVRVRQMP